LAYIGKTPTPAPLTSSDITNGIVTGEKLNADVISSQTELATAPADTDEFLISDAGVLKRLDASLVGGAGITMADNWRLSADDSIDSSETDLDSNWERVDTTGQGFIGSAMTQSSGLFTFPATGIYMVTFICHLYGDQGSDYGRAIIQHENGSGTYTILTDCRAHYGNAENICIPAQTLFDVQNTSNDRVRFMSGGNTNGNLVKGNTSQNRTSATFVRLGDT